MGTTLMSAKPQSQCRQNFSEASEAALNEQINMELYASYAYQAASRHFQRDDVALHGFAKYFQHASDEEREHAEKFQKYLLLRGAYPLESFRTSVSMTTEHDSPLTSLQQVAALCSPTSSLPPPSTNPASRRWRLPSNVSARPSRSSTTAFHPSPPQS